MKLLKLIKIHRKLRVEQEILFHKVVLWSQKKWKEDEEYTSYPKLNDYRSVNKAVKNVEKKLPNIYFILSDIFGGSSSLKKLVEKEKKKQGLSYPQID